jgi:ceramide glucosyltransferase
VAGLPAEDAVTALTALKLAGPGVEIVYCAFSETDPVVAPIRARLAERPDVGARLLTGRSHTTRNPKLDNVDKAYQAVDADIVMMVDGNVQIEAGLANRALALFDHQSALVSAVPIATEPEGFAAVVECAFLNTLYARWQLFSDEIGSGFGHGKLLVLRRSIMDRAGGFDALRVDTAEDCSATKMARSLGLEVRLLKTPIAQPIGRRSLGSVWNRFVRWAQLRRESFPVVYGFEFLRTPFIPMVLAGIAATNAGLSPVVAGLALLAFWYGVEAALAYAAKWPCPPLFLPACFVRDVMELALWPAALLKRGYSWRGEDVSSPVRTADMSSGQFARLRSDRDRGRT